mmetsp:Transcript_12440/g.18570  ORF Transcript_12440/g.18570 Transcript_12440/m.18570 type:complete len:244 (+) Transcript_12440:122-853(+)|eukprot:CAMPEP_0167754994 /NCGR_PEP_ID=MMETSP0110_2-20121227/8580_1 /TAXON_ID=629695 /ORGANISM="Gymnochlora sp., Strain CCMP2014" /LENGTH=243 /DNA_ID=CAMNT_0007640937 /DNA_START=73 /DNA_END=804 /DNA_ORIENTATION=-
MPRYQSATWGRKSSKRNTAVTTSRAPWATDFDKPAPRPIRRSSVTKTTSPPWATDNSIAKSRRSSVSVQRRSSTTRPPWAAEVKTLPRGRRASAVKNTTTFTKAENKVPGKKLTTTKNREVFAVIGAGVRNQAPKNTLKTGKKLIRTPKREEIRRPGRKMVQPELRGDNIPWKNDPTLAAWRPINTVRRNSIRRGQKQHINILNPTFGSPKPIQKSTKGKSLISTSKRIGGYNSQKISNITFG